MGARYNSREVNYYNLDDWLTDIEDNYLCTVRMSVQMVRVRGKVREARYVVEICLPNLGVLAARQYRGSHAVPAGSRHSPAGSFYLALLNLAYEMDVDPQTKFWRKDRVAAAQA